MYYLSILYSKSRHRLWAQVYLFANELKSNLCYQCQSNNRFKSNQHSTDTSSVTHITDYTLYRCHQIHFYRTITTTPSPLPISASSLPTNTAIQCSIHFRSSHYSYQTPSRLSSYSYRSCWTSSTSHTLLEITLLSISIPLTSSFTFNTKGITATISDISPIHHHHLPSIYTLLTSRFFIPSNLFNNLPTFR